MKFIFSNVKGLANSLTRLALKKLLKVNKPDFCIIVGIGMSLPRSLIIVFITLKWIFFSTNKRHGMIPNIWCLCSNHLNHTLIRSNDKLVTFSFFDNQKLLTLSGIYASIYYFRRRALWSTLSQIISNINSLWYCIGDFNTIIGSHEHKGSQSPYKTPWKISLIGQTTST